MTRIRERTSPDSYRNESKIELLLPGSRLRFLNYKKRSAGTHKIYICELLKT